MTRSFTNRAAVLWRGAMLGIGALALSAQAALSVPLPKPRPIPRSVVPKTAQTLSQLPVNPKLSGQTQPLTLASKPPVQPSPAPPTALAPQPKRPSSSPPLAIATTTTTSRADMAALKQIIDMVRAGKAREASELQGAITDPVARKLSEWIILRSSGNGASSDRYRAFLSENPSWPSQSFLRRRGEAALWDDSRDNATVLAFFGDEQPLSGKGRLMLARAMLARGDRRTAERLVREAWRTDAFFGSTEDSAFAEFGSLLSRADIKARMDMLLYGEDDAGALRSAKRLGPAYVALAKAHIAADRQAKNSKALLNAVPRELHGDPGYIFTRIQLLRREDKIAEAARLMLSAPRDPALLVNTDRWWIERRLVARKLLDNNDIRTAYRVAREAAVPDRDIYEAEHQFTAGWIALRFLNDPSTAARHFAHLGTDTVNPTALARAGYWQGRAAEAAGRSQDARAAYQAASMHSTSYYGQLARARLGLPQLGLHEAPPRSRAGMRLEVVRAVALLYALDETELAIPILADMGGRADADALAALGELTERNKDARGMLMIGRAALNRGLPFDHYAYPVIGIPSYRTIGPQVEKAIVFAIARQESAFNPKIVSPAQAYGLMQVTPGAGRYVTKRFGATFDLGKLKNDPSYNATLGAAELSALIGDYNGSYIMTFAGYNAGRGSVRKWIARYGDPRDPKIDAVDWVEQIPFSETRNYVQRIMENLQVYRTRFGGGRQLLIEADLRRGVAAQ